MSSICVAMAYSRVSLPRLKTSALCSRFKARDIGYSVSRAMGVANRAQSSPMPLTSSVVSLKSASLDRKAQYSAYRLPSPSATNQISANTRPSEPPPAMKSLYRLAATPSRTAPSASKTDSLDNSTLAPTKSEPPATNIRVSLPLLRVASVKNRARPSTIVMSRPGLRELNSGAYGPISPGPSVKSRISKSVSIE